MLRDIKSKQKLFSLIDFHLLHDKKPSAFLNDILRTSELNDYPFCLLSRMAETMQSPKHHPEGSVWNHTMLAVDEAAAVKNKSQNPAVLLWSALLHDIGKPAASKNRNGKITFYDHDKIGAKLAREFLAPFVTDDNFIENVSLLVRWHMQILFVVNGSYLADLNTMKKQVDLDEVALLGLCDRLGRLGINKEKEKQNIDLFKAYSK